MNDILKRGFVICAVEVRVFLGTLRFHGKNTIAGDRTRRHIYRTSVWGACFYAKFRRKLPVRNLISSLGTILLELARYMFRSKNYDGKQIYPSISRMRASPR